MRAAFLHGTTATVLRRVQLGFKTRASLPFFKTLSTFSLKLFSKRLSNPLHPTSRSR